MTTSIQIDWWQVLTFAGLIVGSWWALGKLLLRQYDLRLEERFTTQERAREQAQAHWDDRFRRIESDSRAREREVLQLKADLPISYVRREDYVRGQTVIEAKLDALAIKLENMQLKGTQK